MVPRRSENLESLISQLNCATVSSFLVPFVPPTKHQGGGLGPSKKKTLKRLKFILRYDISIGNRMNASAFRDLWARVMF